MVEHTVERRVQQRQVLALLLALGALVSPVSGAVLYGGTDPIATFVFVGAISLNDFIPVLMLVGAFGLLIVVQEGGAPRTGIATAVAVLVALAGGVLALGYFGSAYELRAGGDFAFSTDGERADWTFTRLALVGSLVITGVLCTWVLVLAGAWMTDRRRGDAR